MKAVLFHPESWNSLFLSSGKTTETQVPEFLFHFHAVIFSGVSNCQEKNYPTLDKLGFILTVVVSLVSLPCYWLGNKEKIECNREKYSSAVLKETSFIKYKTCQCDCSISLLSASGIGQKINFMGKQTTFLTQSLKFKLILLFRSENILRKKNLMLFLCQQVQM